VNFGDEPTEAEIEVDKATGIKIGLNALGGVAGLRGGAAGVVLAAGLTPVWDRIGDLLAGKLSPRRARNVVDTLTVGAAAVGLPVDELLERAVAGDERHELLVRALTVAQDTAWQNKRHALGRAVAAA
jgi:hypothetical protein